MLVFQGVGAFNVGVISLYLTRSAAGPVCPSWGGAPAKPVRHPKPAECLGPVAHGGPNGGLVDLASEDLSPVLV